MRVKVEIVRRPEVADPPGVTVVRALRELGFEEVSEARFNRTIVLELDGTDPLSARARVEEMCRRLLANPVIEDFDVQVLEQ
ncbi:MAG TPA: phosphoribosylformylglycinamidine synthase subunit PurS [Acidimicrobiia bacterium]|nr:phosphoribosylformylglycinamidine synthase subunit PurS [Acidimicrobiia bacterium]